jgi:hypothetical protein
MLSMQILAERKLRFRIVGCDGVSSYLVIPDLTIRALDSLQAFYYK